jgi:hypothetical protein
VEWFVYRDGRQVAGPFRTEGEAEIWLHRYQGQSIHWATTYEGYEIKRGADDDGRLHPRRRADRSARLADGEGEEAASRVPSGARA